MGSFEGIVSINLWTWLFTLINFILVYLIVKKILYKPVKKMIEERENEIKEKYRLADEAKENAYELEKHYELIVKGAKDEANKIVNSALKKANLQSEEILEKANKSSIDIIKKAHNQIKSDRNKMINEVKNDISEIAIMTASKLIEKNINTQDHDIIIENFIDQLKKDDISCQPQ